MRNAEVQGRLRSLTCYAGCLGIMVLFCLHGAA